ncbi:M23 family metallopeptidase [Leptolyngbya sp. FACHB-36]|uniref:M23 family metallopeptidase n=1 Tax=Leptolyngbya sp. FACHB-36 TaxID=2692808 RepID=UPI001680E8AA|nr:M23 family metallopeptidase [Leptolyngbya sp. FACHB-36]MBD2022645.1 M23 family metallopeptidase [Leptolyngbya sp. FACHB-36]
MTRNATAQPLQSVLQRLLLLQGLGWLGVGVLSSGMALAQAPTVEEIPDPMPIQSAAPVPAVEPPAPIPTAPESFPPLALPAPATTRAPIAPAPRPAAVEYEAPSTIVFSERSTGCQSTVQSGQSVMNGPCGAPKPVAPPIAREVSTGVSAVQVGPLAVGSSGIGLATTTPSVRSYYNRTIRPPGRLGNGNVRLIFPLSIPAVISSAFGWRVHPVTGDQRLHAGTDLAAPMGTPVLAAVAGRVAIADFLGGYGLAVTLEHNKATQQTLYGHLSEIFVKPGEWVEQGTTIGRVGSTGMSTGPHLHFEFRQSTPDGWVALDAGVQLEYALAQLVNAMQTAQAKPGSKG